MVNGPWGGYSNGNIPPTALTRINYEGVVYWSWSSDPADGALDGVYLEPGCAAALVAMLELYHQQTGAYLPVNEGYRSYQGQVYWRAQDSRNAVPGFSNHGWGKAVDFGDITLDQYNWILANCGAFGFSKLGGPYGNFDYIHFDYSGSFVPPQQGGPFMALSDAQQADLLFKTGAIYDAMFAVNPTSLGSSAGVLKAIGGLEQKAGIQYDATFKTTPVTLGDGTVLPGGVLKSLKAANS